MGLYLASCQVHGDTKQQEFLLIGPGKVSLRSWHCSQKLDKGRISINRAHTGWGRDGGTEPSRRRVQPKRRLGLQVQGVALKLSLGPFEIVLLLGWGLAP